MLLLDVNHVDFQRQVFWGFITLVQFLRGGMPDMGHVSLAPQETLRICEIPPECGSLHRDGVFSETGSLSLLPI